MVAAMGSPMVASATNPQAQNSFNNVNITKAYSRVQFQKFGQTISEISFATIKSKLNFEPMINETDAVCRTAKMLEHQLRSKLEVCKPTNPEAAYRTVGEALSTCDHPDEPWKNYVKKKLIRAFIDELLHICQDNKEKFKEIADTFHLTLEATKEATEVDRKRRQIFTAIVASIVTSLVSTFTASQLFGMTKDDADMEGIISNQNHFIAALQDHESRLTRDEYHIKRLQHHLDVINNELRGMVKQDTILAESNAALGFARSLNNHVTQVQRGLYKLLNNKLDPNLVSLTMAKRAINRATEAASKKGFTMALGNPSDIYQLETNFVAFGTDIFSLTHIPLIKENRVADIYRLLPTTRN